MEKTSFVVMIGGFPLAVGPTLETAQANAFAAETKYQQPDAFEHRWDEYEPGKVWRLMQRYKGRKGRFSWTQYAVHAVSTVGGEA
jgi:hypothetical protein